MFQISISQVSIFSLSSGILFDSSILWTPASKLLINKLAFWNDLVVSQNYSIAKLEKEAYFL